MAMNPPVGVPLTPALNRRQQELEQALGWLDGLLAGRTPEGFVPTLQNWSGVLNLLGDVAQTRGVGAIQPAMQQWVEPALSGALGRDLQHQAMELLASTAQSGGVDPRLMQFLSAAPTTAQDFATRANILSQLAPQFAWDPGFQQVYANFLKQAAPGGSVVGAPVSLWGAAAQPYFAMQTVMGGPEQYQMTGLPQVQFPADASNMPRQAQEVVRAINEAALATQGLQIGPHGVMSETPAEMNRRIQAAMSSLLSSGFGQTPDLAAGAAPWTTQGPTIADPTAIATGEPQSTWWNAIQENIARLLNPPQQMLGPFQSAFGAVAPAEEKQQAQNEVNAIKEELRRIGASSDWGLAEVTRLMPQLIERFGKEAAEDLHRFVQTLPGNRAWMPPFGISPIQTALSIR